MTYLFLFDFPKELHFTETLSSLFLNKIFSFHINETLTFYYSALPIEVYKLCLFHLLWFLFWRDRLKMKNNYNNGEDPNDPNNNDVGENLTEIPSRKTESAGWVMS